MDFVLFIKQVINGIQVGSVYALVALGYTMVYGIVKLINFAHGDFIMVGGYVAVFLIPFLLNMGVPAWVSAVASVAVCALIGVLTEKIAYKPLRGAPSLSVLITAIAVSLFLENLALLLFSSAPRPVSNVFNMQPVNVGPVQFSGISVITIVLSLIIMAALQLFIKGTRMGKAMRAVSEDGKAAILMGISTNRTISLTFAIGSGLAGIAAVMYCAAYPQVQPYMGTMLGLKAFVAAVLGGIGSIPGAMLGGILIGLVESMTKGYISTQLADAVVFSILIIVLLVKPTGIFGKNVGEKV
ncbi:branched-chain amino acid ABC transporter permease [Marasmitruncus massiliensis]|uniref:branched-chain amino acid ABC transporter permease n=1 Tax=Marasmitruncus massiliensis TaxID=1944642 RepID=UPI000C7CB759|nr:branched-chain amino acid ABC transporter permease [Marasmitruncus massiliensis]